MTNPTSNFGWQMPTASDLVTDLPADFETFGQAVDTSLADLKGGTTGQVLSKASNTDMDFTWVAQDDSNAIQNAIVDAKGDLIAASAADTPARLAVGANGETLVADSSATSGLRYKVPVTLANPVINGGFDVWQRGTSFSIAAASAYQYTADRWAVQNGANQAVTISRQTVSDTTNLPSIQYAARVQRNSGQTGTGDYYLDCPIETANSIPFVGRAVTLSFFARGGATFISAGDTLQAQLIYAVGIDQNPTTWTSPAIISSNTVSLTSTMARYVVTGTVPTNATQLFIRFTHKPVGTAGATDYYDVTGVQISQNIDDNSNGSTTPPFRRSQGTIQGETSACQRYYYDSRTADAQPPSASGIGQNVNRIYTNANFAVSMRVRPTVTLFSYANTAGKISLAGSASDVGSTVTAESQQITKNAFIQINDSGTGFVAASLYWFAYTANSEL